jgi:CRP/FNR family transcriptional regulator, cyclic AMP receptor protein
VARRFRCGLAASRLETKSAPTPVRVMGRSCSLHTFQPTFRVSAEGIAPACHVAKLLCWSDERRSASSDADPDLDLAPRLVVIPTELQRLVRTIATKKKHDFDPKLFLATIGEGRKIVLIPGKQTIFTQGDAADTVFYIQKGKVRLTVVSEKGKEATIAILNPGDFCGEGGLAGQPLRMGSAIAMTDCELMRIDKTAMMLALHRESKLSDMFTAYLLGRNIRYEADLVDQLFSSSEKRLARILLLLSHFGKEGVPETVIPKVSQETLADMVGTTRSRVSFFMNRFRKLGFVDYGEGGMQVHSSLLNVVLHD